MANVHTGVRLVCLFMIHLIAILVYKNTTMSFKNVGIVPMDAKLALQLHLANLVGATSNLLDRHASG